MKYFVVSEKELVEAVEHFEDSDYCSIAYIERLVEDKEPIDTELYDLFITMYKKFKEIHRFHPKYLISDEVSK